MLPRTPLLPLILTLMLLTPAGPIHASEAPRLPLAENLQQLAYAARERRIPILLVVSQSHCGYCELMRNEVLIPMQLSGDYRERALMRELMIDPGEMVTNFQGQRETADAFRARYQVHVTPTLLFLDDRGQEVAERILGINTLDYLLFYIEAALDSARQAMTRHRGLGTPADRREQGPAAQPDSLPSVIDREEHRATTPEIDR